MSADLKTKVSDELVWDPKVGSDAIAVGADGGAVTLRGTVGSLREKREARKAAERVFGVKSVKNELQVRLLDRDGREDADLRADVLRALLLDTLVPASVDAEVKDGYVTLIGTADWQYQRDEAEFITSCIVDVLGVVDQITLTPQPNAGEVKGAIKKSFKRNAALDADKLSVKASNGTVTVKGTVSSWAEHDEAVNAAWAAPGVTNVEDRIRVEY